MKKKTLEIKTHPYKLLLMGLIVLISGLFVLLWIKKDNKRPANINTNKPEVYMFTSDVMKFSTSYPSHMIYEEGHTTATFKNNEGTITISRNATNFDNVNDYLELSKTRNNLEVLSTLPIELNGYDSLLVETLNFDQSINRTYYIYVDHLVYLISTNTKTLYTEQDLIADSFTYTPLDP